MSEPPWRLALASVRDDFRQLQLSRIDPLNALLVEYRHPPLPGIYLDALPPLSSLSVSWRGPFHRVYSGQWEAPDSPAADVALLRRGWVFGDMASLETFGSVADRAWVAYCGVPGPVLQLVPEASQARYYQPRPGEAVYLIRHLFGTPGLGNDGRENIGLWLVALFEIALRRVPSVPLHAERMTWWDSHTIHLEDLAAARHLSQTRPDLQWTVDRLPASGPYHWFATLRDIVSASVYACDYLLSLGVGRQDGTGLAEAEKSGGARKAKRGRRGRAVSTDPEKDRKLLEDWRAAKGQSASREEFCRGRGITVQQLIDAQHRVKHRRRTDAE
jgi:hypothetical protein